MLDPPPPPPTAPPLPPSLDVATGIPVPTAPPPDFLPTPQPPGHPVVVRPLPPSRWSTGLCDCFDDVGNCCLTLCCPCVTFGRVAAIASRGSASCGLSCTLYAMIMCLTGCSCLYSCCYRSKLRRLLFLEETPCCDCLVHWCCEPCALCQEHRELRWRGLDPKKGWRWDLEERSRGGWSTPPVVEGGMAR